MASIESFFHVAIKSPAIDEEVDFFETYLDADVVERETGSGTAADDVSYAALSVGDKRVYLFDRAPYEAEGAVDEVTPGFLHFGYVVDDVREVAAELTADGVPLLMKPTTFGGLRIAFFTAPSGTRIELLEHLS